MTPSWYDLLGVEADASSDEIRTAWKAGIADLDPADRRFRMLNQAAEVLLEPTARAAYDAELAPDPVVEPVETPATDLGDPTPMVESTERRGVPGWVLAGLAVLTAVVVGLAALLATKPSDAAAADGTSEAQATAESSAATILSYDYRTMDEDQAAAGALMTADYREEYDKLFSALKADATQVKIQVTTELVASGITRAEADRVEVLVFVNRPTTNAETKEPRVYRDQVTMTMENVDGEWLVDGLKTTPTSG